MMWESLLHHLGSGSSKNSSILYCFSHMKKGPIEEKALPGRFYVGLRKKELSLELDRVVLLQEVSGKKFSLFILLIPVQTH